MNSDINKPFEAGSATCVATLYDIHGNLPALEAVLDDVRRAGADHIVVGGDVFPGPMSGEALACLLTLDLPVSFLRGNGDREVLAFPSGDESGAVPERLRAAVRWVAQRLDPEHRRLMERWPATVRLELKGLGAVLFCHATPGNDTDIFTRLTPEERLRPIFEGLDVALVVCGHTHMQFDRTIGKVHVVNSGSVGMPFGRAGAHWLLLGPGVEPRHTPYDLVKAAERVRATDYPDAGTFADRNIMQPPTEQEVLDVFSKVELR